jgi:pyruvate dehydrogenase E2 component (dihydrolipoamide acetyltransferase)
MPEYILMPMLSPGMTEGKLSRWLKAEGDAVVAGEVIAEIETDKATMEFEAAAAGTLGQILVAAGAAAGVNSPIAVLLRDGEAAAGPEPRKEPTAAPVRAPITAPEPKAPARPNRIFATPVARRLARELGLDLATVAGSGPQGRILRVDVEAARPLAGASRPVAVTPAPMALAAPAPAAPGSRPTPRQASTPVPNSAVRKVIARRLLEAKQTIPHYYLTIDVELDALLDVRERFNARPGASYRFTVNDLVVKAVALALGKVPAVNAMWTDEATLRFDAVDVAVAVATEAGLITPIVRDADRKTVAAISGEIKALADRARAGRLRPEEFQGGGFTVSNLGMHGVREFAAIINPPQSCILAVGAAEPRPVVRGGEIVARTMMTCTLSADHRTVDGAVGAEFLAAFKTYLEDPLVLFL